MSRSIRLCTDSSAQLPRDLAAALGVDVVPVAVLLDDEPIDEPEIEVDRFYELLRQGARATTSQPGPGRFAETYSRAARTGARELLSIHLSAAVSGTVAAAELAAREASLPVTVVDTGTVSFGVSLCVRAAARALADGGATREALRAIERFAPTLRNAFVAGGAPGGRVPRAEDLRVLSFRDGRTETLGPAATLDHAAELIAARALAHGEPIGVAVGHAETTTAQAADALADTLAGSGRVVEVIRYRVGPSIGAHTGPCTYGAFWWPAAGAGAA